MAATPAASTETGASLDASANFVQRSTDLRGFVNEGITVIVPLVHQIGLFSFQSVSKIMCAFFFLLYKEIRGIFPLPSAGPETMSHHEAMSLPGSQVPAHHPFTLP